jgi:hypothetical protein
MFSGITGKDFQSATAGSEVRRAEVVVEIPVGIGVIGEYFFGLGVAVGRGANASAGNVCVAPLMGIMTDSGVDSPVQAVIKTQTIGARNTTRIIRAKYSREKLINDEILCYRVPHTYSSVAKLEVKM